MRFLKIFGVVILVLVIAFVSYVVYVDYMDEKEYEESQAQDKAFIEAQYIPVVNAYLSSMNSCDIEGANQLLSNDGNKAISKSAELKAYSTSIYQSSCKELSLSIRDLGTHRSLNSDKASIRLKLTANIKSKNTQIDDDIYGRWEFVKENGEWKINNLTAIEFAATIMKNKLGIEHKLLN
jgi:hypothetical protein